ncbi:DUF6223 family protein [Streptomyces thinghirensis]|nr:DUF6223 family protein [Streptomyces thinghirensis]
MDAAAAAAANARIRWTTGGGERRACSSPSNVAISGGEGGERYECFSNADGGRRGWSHRRRADRGQPGPRGGAARPGHRLAGLTRAGGRISTGNARTGGMTAIAVGAAGTILAVLHVATAGGGPGTGNGLVGAVAAIPLGLGAVFLGRRALIRSRRDDRPTDRTTV